MANLFKDKPVVKVVMLKGQDGEEKLINQADESGLSFWIGTQAEYDAIPEADLIHNCVYYITDDTSDDFRAELDALDTKVDNNTTAIETNTSDIADNTADITAIKNKAIPIDIEDEGYVGDGSKVDSDASYWQAQAVNGIAHVCVHLSIRTVGSLPSGAKFSDATKVVTGLPKPAIRNLWATAVGGKGYNMRFSVDTSGNLYVMGYGDSTYQNLNAGEGFIVNFDYPYTEEA